MCHKVTYVLRSAAHKSNHCTNYGGGKSSSSSICSRVTSSWAPAASYVLSSASCRLYASNAAV